MMMLSSLPSRECMSHRSALQRSLPPQPCDESGTQVNTSVVFPAACLELGTVEKQAFLCSQSFTQMHSRLPPAWTLGAGGHGPGNTQPHQL